MVQLESKVDDIWSRAAKAYAEVVLPYPDYQRFMTEVRLALVGRRTILDLGCGLGVQMGQLLSDFETYVVGVDSNKRMLDHAVDFLSKTAQGRFELHCADAVDFKDNRRFDAVLSTNVLFNLPGMAAMKYLDTTYRMLNERGILVLSSPYEKVNIPKRKLEMEDHYREIGQLDEKQEFIDTVWNINAQIAQSACKTYHPDKIAEILTQFIGFDRILYSGNTFNQNFLVVAEKGRECAPVQLGITNQRTHLEGGWRLRTHWLVDRLEALSAETLRPYRDPCDESGIGAYAADSTGRTVAFLNYVRPSTDLAPFGNRPLLRQLQDAHGELGFFNGFYAMGTKNGKLTGSYLHACLINWIQKNQPDVGAIVSEVIPTAVSFAERFGGRVVGEPFECSGKKKFPVYPVLFECRSSPVVSAVERALSEYHATYGVPDVKITVDGK